MRQFARLLIITILAGTLGVGALLAALFLLPPLHTAAATVIVTVKTDTTTGVATNCPGSSCSLRDALAVAGPNDTITFDPSLNNQTIILANGTLTLTQNVTIQGPGAGLLAVDGGCPTCGAGGAPSGGVTVFTVNSAVTNATISGLTIQHGNAGSGNGGGIINSGTLALTNSTVSSNSTVATYSTGGGIENDGTLTVTNSIVHGNAAGGTGSAGGGYGGGIASGGALTVTNSTVSGNVANGGGGGIYNHFGTLTVTGGTIGGLTASDGNTAGNSGGGILSQTTSAGTTGISLGGVTISHNTANDTRLSGGGGGLYIVEFNNLATSTITNSTITSNTATDGAGGNGGDGGGIAVGDGNVGTTTITNSTISGNTAFDTGDEGFGGGIVNFAGTTNLMSSTLLGNTANGTHYSDGGGIANNGTFNVTGSTISGNTSVVGTGGGVSNYGSMMTITNSTIVGNAATGLTSQGQGRGGGIFNGSNSVIQLTYTTVARNTANSPLGGGVRTKGTLQSLGTVIAANTGGDCSILAPGIITSQGYNLDDDGSCTLTMPTDRPSDPNPGLATALAANGSTGPQTLALLSGSDAIDRGGASANGCPATDERGVVRPQPAGGQCDIGAFEAQGTPNPLPPRQPTGIPVLTTPLPLPKPPQPTGLPITNATPLPLPPRRP
ncbi:MAG: choice-of-anchor Q domain-containing protein [Thermomicrobiales bacterium]